MAIEYVELSPGWLERQIREVRQEVTAWPESFRDRPPTHKETPMTNTDQMTLPLKILPYNEGSDLCDIIDADVGLVASTVSISDAERLVAGVNSATAVTNLAAAAREGVIWLRDGCNDIAARERNLCEIMEAVADALASALADPALGGGGGAE